MNTRIRIFIVVLLVVIIVIAGWFLLCGRQPIRNVILISIDTCRADHLNCYGFGRKTTPNIDAIARESVLFENAFTPMPLTLPAHSSMLTGTYPPYHKVHDNLNYRLGESNVTIAEILRGHGYTSGAIVSCFVLDRQFGTSQGFDSYNDKFEHPIGPQDFERRGDDASRFACNWLEEHRDEPFFLFLHYYDPHTEYDPPEPFASEYADDLYSGEIAYTDHCIGQVIEKLKSLGLYDSTLLIIVGDHGEGLGEHGEAEHGYYIYEPMIKVPFIIRVPGCRRPKRINDIVDLTDVVPTILSFLEIPIPAYIQGKDLSGYSRSRLPSGPERRVYAESLTPTKYGCNPLVGLIGERWKYIETTRPELYDLAQDPFEENNLVEKEAERARFMRGQLQEMMAQLAGAESADGKMELDEESRRRLESLGYVGSDVVDDSFEFDPGKKDPKDLIQYAECAVEITHLLCRQKHEEGRAICDRLLTEWPEMPNTHLMLTRIASAEGKMAEVIEHGMEYLAMTAGTVDLDSEPTGLSPMKPVAMTHKLIAKAAYKLGKFDLAIEHLTEALRIKPGWPEVLNELAAAYFQQGRFDEAVMHWAEALRLEPTSPEMHNNLAGAFYKQGRIDEAIEHWAEALRLKPDWQEVRDNLDKLVERKKRDEEIAQYTEMLTHDPDDPDIHNKLAGAFYRQGRTDKAIEHWTEAVRLNPNWAESRNSLATAFYRRGDIEKSIEHWTVAVELKPDWAEAGNNLAWVLATIDDEELRNPVEAIELAERAGELTDYSSPGILDTLGVAYAAAGRFDEAVKTAERAIELAREAKQEEMAEDIRSRLELYRMNKPYHD